MSWKEWDQGEVVEAGDFQEYIQDQVVQNYADSAARSTALGTAVAEGMVSYLQDSNSVQVYDGSAWQAVAPVSHNYIINGAMEIDQRGTAFPSVSDDEYTVDRWQIANVGSEDVDVTQIELDADALVSETHGSFQNALRVTVNNWNGESAIDVAQRIENARTTADKTITVSFYAKASANCTVGLRGFNFLDSGTTSAFSLGGLSVTTSWQRFEETFTTPALTGSVSENTSMRFSIRLQDVSDFPDGTSIDITGVQLEAGSIATPFKRNANSIQGELAACQRYYRRLTQDTGKSITNASSWSTTRAYGVIAYPVPMRANPSIEASANSAFKFLAAGTTYDSTGYGEVLGRTDSVQFYIDTTGMTIGESGWIRIDGDDDWLEFDAEL